MAADDMVLIFEAANPVERDFVIDRVCQQAGVFSRPGGELGRATLGVYCRKAERKRALTGIPSKAERLRETLARGHRIPLNYRKLPAGRAVPDGV